jgi:TolB-like protein
MAKDIITELSRSRTLAIISRYSSFTHRGRRVDIRQIGHALGVRYVLEGSLRHAGAQIRINAQLIEAETGTYVCAER